MKTRACIRMSILPTILLVMVAQSLSADIPSQYIHKVDQSLIAVYCSLNPPETEPSANEALASAVSLVNLQSQFAVFNIGGMWWMSGFLVGSATTEELVGNGVIVRTRIDSLMTVAIPIDSIPSVVAIPGVRFIEIAKVVGKQLNQSSQKITARQTQDWFGLDGRNVVMGIVDSGIDFDGLDFKNDDGTTRILYLWDQNSTIGPPPSGYNYGREWTASQINSGLCSHVDDNGHGTHVAGIATGNGRAFTGFPSDSYKGIAPRADILFVAAQRLGGGYNEASIIDGMAYIRDRAEQLNKPWVINISLGKKYGPKDGTSPFEQFVTSLVNLGFGKGRIVTVSAGNEGWVSGGTTDNSAKFHSRVIGNGTSQFITSALSPRLFGEFFLIEIWYPGTQNYRVSIDPPGNARVFLQNCSFGPDISTYSWGNGEGTGQPGQGFATEIGLISVHNNHFSQPPFPFTPDRQIQIIVEDRNFCGTNRFIPDGTWTITMSNGSGAWDVYIPIKSIGLTYTYFTDASHDNTRKITEPGNAVKILTAGSFNSKNGWIDIFGNPQPSTGALFDPSRYPIDQISTFSSPGPCRVDVNRFGDPADKPDVFAPGAWVASSKSEDRSYSTYERQFIIPGDKYIHESGTSMSAPHVAGAVALALQLNPDLLISDIKPVLRNQPGRKLDVVSWITTLFNLQVTSNITTTTNWGTGPTKQYVLIRNTTGNFSSQNYYVDGVTLTIGSNAIVVVQKSVRLIAQNGGNIIIQPGARIILAPGGELIAGPGSSIVDNGADISFAGPGACIATAGGTIAFGSNVTRRIEHGGVIASFQPGTIELGPGASLLIEATGTLVWNANTTLQLGSNSQVGISGRVSVAADMTFEIPAPGDILVNPGCQFEMGTNANILVAGHLNVSGTQEKPVVFAPQPGVSSWNGITLVNSCQASGNVEYATIANAANALLVGEQANFTMSNSTIENSSIGIQITPFLGDCPVIPAAKYITNNTMTNVGIGIFLNTTAETHISNNIILGQWSSGNQPQELSAGIRCVGSSPRMLGNRIEGFGYGLHAMDGSSPELEDGFSGGHNVIRNNYIGVKCQDESHAVLGFLSGAQWDEGGQNSIYGNEWRDVVLVGKCAVFAQNNWWGSPEDPSHQFSIEDGSELFYEPWLEEDPNQGHRPFAGGMPLQQGKENGDPRLSPFPDPMRQALAERSGRRHANALGILRLLVGNRQLPDYARRWAISQLIPIAQRLPDGGVSAFLRLAEGAHPNLVRSIRAALPQSYVSERSVSEALASYEANIQRYPNSDIERRALYGMFSLSLYNSGDTNRARASYNALVARYSTSTERHLAEVQLALFNSQLSASSGRGQRVANLEKNEHNSHSAPSDFALHQNFPNPFNPSTTIKYSLPVQTHVTLKVFDVMGREIQTLVNDFGDAGNHQVEFDANGLASGVYFYRMQAPGFTAVKKFLLLK